MTKMTEEEQYRLQELESQAKEKFIENSDFNVADWIDDEDEKEEYKKLFDKFLEHLKSD